MMFLKNCKGIKSDGAVNKTGKNNGDIKRILDAADNNAIWNHCFIRNLFYNIPILII